MECLGGNGYVEEFPMARMFRQSPLNAIWEGSGNVLALDVLRTLHKVPDAVTHFFAEFGEPHGVNADFDAHVKETKKLLGSAQTASPAELQMLSRRLVQMLARMAQASILLRHQPDIAEAFCRTRLRGSATNHYGSSQFTEAEIDTILAKADPKTNHLLA